MIKKVNIKGKFQIWTHDGEYHEVPLKECHAWTREGCNHCPDFAAEHADISTGGIGKFNDWTLTIVRTDLGREVIRQLVAAGRHRDPAGRRRPGRHRADAQAGGQEPQALAGGRSRAVAPAHPAAGAQAGRPCGGTGSRGRRRPAGHTACNLLGHAGEALSSTQVAMMSSHSWGSSDGSSSWAELTSSNSENGISSTMPS